MQRPQHWQVHRRPSTPCAPSIATIAPATKRSTSSSSEPLHHSIRSWDKLRQARTIAIKFNQDWPLNKVPMFEGQRQQLVSDTVARAVLRLLRENTTATLLCVDGGVHHMNGAVANLDRLDNTGLHLLREFDVEYIDGHAGAGRLVSPFPAAG